MGHVNGAIALVNMRGVSHLQDQTGLTLSVRLSINLLISALAANIPVPSALGELRSDLEPYINKNDPKWQSSGLVAKYANLQGAVTNGHQSNVQMVTRALELDREFVTLTNSIAPAWRYTTTTSKPTSDKVFDKRVDTYGDHFIAEHWNVMRSMRILLHDIVCFHCVDKSSGMIKGNSEARQTARSTLTIDVLAKEICASVPEWTDYQRSSGKTKACNSMRKLRCYKLIWPLYVATKYSATTTRIKPWTLSQLRFMSNDIGIRNASVVAAILDNPPETDPFMVFNMLGTYAFAP